MSSSNDILRLLVAHYLASNYPSVLEPYLQASQLPPPDMTHPLTPDLRTLVEDWSSQQLARDLERTTLADAELAVDGSWRGWEVKDMLRVGLKEDHKLRGVVRTLDNISATNFISVATLKVPMREFDTSHAMYRVSYPLSIVTTSVDKTLRIIDYASGEVSRIIQPHRAAILSFAFHPANPRYLLTGSMDGTAALSDVITHQTLQTFPSSKFVVRVLFSPDGHFMATASYDHHIVIYSATSSPIRPPLGEDDMPLDDTDDPAFACDPTLRYTESKRINVDSNPECILFHPQSKYLMYTTRSSHLLHYVRLPSVSTPQHEEWQILTKNFNPSPLDTHISFSVLHMALHPSGSMIACQTGDSKGGVGERILLYGVEPDETERLACLWTGSEGDDFVLPRMAWVPDGSGIITTTPNGFLNLISLTGECRSSVKIHGAEGSGQSVSEVIRDCCIIPGQEGTWEVISVGYDKRVRISEIC